ncbi:hypothetical protein AB0K60_03005 [Thermopolyspora sp. NPDC052614]
MRRGRAGAPRLSARAACIERVCAELWHRELYGEGAPGHLG